MGCEHIYMFSSCCKEYMKSVLENLKQQSSFKLIFQAVNRLIYLNQIYQRAAVN